MDTGEFMLATRIGQVPEEDVELDQREAWLIAEERLAAVRHDLRNRLGTVRNAGFYLQRRSEKSELWGSDERVPYFFRLMEDELKKAEELLALGLSVAPLSPVEPVSLRRCVARAVATLPQSSQVELAREFPAVPYPLLCEVEVAVLARCLLRNALEASPRGAKVRVKIRASAEAVVLEVADQGPGLSEAEEAKAFQPFIGKPGHLGAGLNLSRRICQRYGASLRLLRPEPGGLAVEVRFPLGEGR